MDLRFVINIIAAVSLILISHTLTADVLDDRPGISLIPASAREVRLEDLMESTYYIVGPGADTLFVDAFLQIEDHLIVMGDGVVIVEGAELKLYGSLWQQDNGKVIIRDGGYLHVMQVFVSQYPQYMQDNSYFEATDAIVYANTTFRTFLHDSSIYIARRTSFPFWNFRECYDMSTLILEDADIVGDLLVNDSCCVRMTRCDTILPWFEAGEEMIMDVEFPDYEFVEHFEFDSTYPGAIGMKYSATFDSCSNLFPGVELKSGGSVTVNNSVFCLALRLSGSHEVYLSGVNNKTYYTFLDFPFVDRILRFVNSYLALWCVYTFDDSRLSMESCYWGEAHARDSSYISAVNCSTNGFPSSVTSVDKGRFDFKDGKVTAFVSSWYGATTYLENAVVAPTRPGIAQSTNIAHQSSKILCVNCEFDSLPFAMDTALVMFSTLQVPDTAEVGDRIAFLGSAWIHAGPHNAAEFKKYTFRWADPSAFEWNFITEDSVEVRNDTLGTWVTDGLREGLYVLRFTLESTEADSLIVYGGIWLLDVGIEEGTPVPLQAEPVIYPNPFNSSLSIFVGKNKPSLQVRIFDIRGKLIAEWSDLQQPAVSKGGLFKSQSSFRWEPNPALASGIYLVRIRTSAGDSYFNQIIYLK
ncbi:T9SS type A sorting domain-containing protein [bacterium]|nr:T9SS type A sorting domain-containing protein [bacterium]